MACVDKYKKVSFKWFDYKSNSPIEVVKLAFKPLSLKLKLKVTENNPYDWKWFYIGESEGISFKNVAFGNDEHNFTGNECAVSGNEENWKINCS
ncbi:hypothetical protein OVS_02080 [Mycoplasma ovis str. Michigan]|uniref:Uncharacterized protein n=1 Tax=Mycoplasma ovis str. Michigan TaxID=1415773 RepID=A0ABM5P1T5_9MOLU|nr:hypothetical protein [Mycoplasma ovis]AHC40278.1 hypothetical protein OVS_02080 [Mycoplasma ovis str. Michigan]